METTVWKYYYSDSDYTKYEKTIEVQVDDKPVSLDLKDAFWIAVTKDDKNPYDLFDTSIQGWRCGSETKTTTMLDAFKEGLSHFYQSHRNKFFAFLLEGEEVTLSGVGIKRKSWEYKDPDVVLSRLIYFPKTKLYAAQELADVRTKRQQDERGAWDAEIGVKTIEEWDTELGNITGKYKQPKTTWSYWWPETVECAKQEPTVGVEIKGKQVTLDLKKAFWVAFTKNSTHPCSIFDENITTITYWHKSTAQFSCYGDVFAAAVSLYCKTGVGYSCCACILQGDLVTKIVLGLPTPDSVKLFPETWIEYAETKQLGENELSGIRKDREIKRKESVKKGPHVWNYWWPLTLQYQEDLPTIQVKDLKGTIRKFDTKDAFWIVVTCDGKDPHSIFDIQVNQWQKNIRDCYTSEDALKEAVDRFIYDEKWSPCFVFEVEAEVGKETQRGVGFIVESYSKDVITTETAQLTGTIQLSAEQVKLLRKARMVERMKKWKLEDAKVDKK